MLLPDFNDTYLKKPKHFEKCQWHLNLIKQDSSKKEMIDLLIKSINSQFFILFFQADFLSLSNLGDILVKGLLSCTFQVYCSVSWHLLFQSKWKLKDAVEESLVLLVVIWVRKLSK